MSIPISNTVHLPESELEFSAIRAQGAGGQNVNKVSSAIHLRFDIVASSLPEPLKQRLMATSDRRITQDGVVVIKAQQYRTQEKNRQEAIERLVAMIRAANVVPRKRRLTQPSKAAKQRRIDSKKQRGAVKSTRGKVDF